MSNQNQIPEVKPGRYRHYKGNDYLVLGVARYQPEGGALVCSQLGHAILSGTEDDDPPRVVWVYEHVDGTYSYMGQPYGDVVLYRPDYGDRHLNFRVVVEFTENVRDAPRFVYVD